MTSASNMKKLSTGYPATLGGYRDLTASMFGSDSAALTFLDEKIQAQGRDEPVLAEEGQMVYLLTSLHLRSVATAVQSIRGVAPHA
jgi:hypothetical protein